MTEHFRDAEFACHCGCGTNRIQQSVLEALEKLRALIGNKPINVYSGYRCAKHPVEAAKTEPGWHAKGLAADISVRGMTARQLYNEALQVFEFNGFGVADEEAYLHVDLRPAVSIGHVKVKPARWCYQSGRVVPWYEV